MMTVALSRLIERQYTADEFLGRTPEAGRERTDAACDSDRSEL
jgi:hypothetical protein